MNKMRLYSAIGLIAIILITAIVITIRVRTDDAESAKEEVAEIQSTKQKVEVWLKKAEANQMDLIEVGDSLCGLEYEKGYGLEGHYANVSDLNGDDKPDSVWNFNSPKRGQCKTIYKFGNGKTEVHFWGIWFGNSKIFFTDKGLDGDLDEMRVDIYRNGKRVESKEYDNKGKVTRRDIWIRDEDGDVIGKAADFDGDGKPDHMSEGDDGFKKKVNEEFNIESD